MAVAAKPDSPLASAEAVLVGFGELAHVSAGIVCGQLLDRFEDAGTDLSVESAEVSAGC
ncbi:MAG: hypothetical protein ABSG43_22985 [Solirubrobacteraceae bacterium]